MEDWDILNLYFKNHKYPFTNHHLDSYKELIKTYIPNTIKSYNPITMIKYNDLNEIIMKVDVFVGGLNSDEIFIDRPIYIDDGIVKLITPNDARLKNLTYETHIYANIVVNIYDEEENLIVKKFDNVAIGSIPIMLHSDICLLNNQGSKVLSKLGECIYDNGGYFIIDGKEKVIIAQERIVTNRLFTTKIKNDQNFSYKGLIRCTGDVGETVLSPRSVMFYLVKNPDITMEDDVIENYKKLKGSIVVELPSVEGKIPLFILFRALGIESDKEIYELIFGSDNNETEKIFFENFIRPSIINSKYDDTYIYTQEEALKYLKFRVKYQNIDHVKYILSCDVFPNIILFQNKGKYLGYLIKQMINVILGISDESDRDNYIYKRVDISGFLLAELFQECYSKLRKKIRDKLDNFYYYGTWKNNKDYNNYINNDNIYKLIPNVFMADTFVKSLKGRWGMSESTDPELGKVQDLSRISYIGFLSHLRRVNIAIDRSLKITSPHKLHTQQWGIMCPFETPDGASVGYLKNLAFLSKITAGTNTDNIKKCLIDIGIILLEYYNLPLNRNITKVFINNTLFGITGDPITIMKILKTYRRNNLINILTSISFHIKSNEIRILTEAGRCCRPLIIISNINKIKYTNWFDLIIGSTLKLKDDEKNEEIYYKNEYINPQNLTEFKNMDFNKIIKKLEENECCIEFIDIEESDTCYIAMNKNDINKFHTHLEIHPSTILSVVTGNIPMCNHNQSARNVFHAAQSKQAIGIYATNFNKRFDTFGFIQHYAQRPIINTKLSQYTGSDAMPNGFNTIVAIMTYSGFNQEDSIMINKNSVERGLFHLSYFKSITATAKIVSPYERIIFGNPTKFIKDGIKINNLKHADYTLINDEGFIKEGSYIPHGQKVVVIGMISIRDVYIEEKKGIFIEKKIKKIYTDISITSDDSYYGYINKVFIDNKTNDNDTKICKVKFLKIKIPEFGDKHASRHGQKGVIGMVIPQESMPFTKDGIVPDIIINPHAIPSRMTIGHLVECIYAKLCCLKGVLGDATVFIPIDNNKIYDGLVKNNFNSHGNEILYNGYTGKQINVEIFIGPTYYFRLKHMVNEKINARGLIGPKVLLTRQPTGGRRKAGGLRIGEMERDSLICHGISNFIKETMMERSDKFRWCICKKCGTLPNYTEKINSSICNFCNNNDLAVIETPYCFKLLIQELESMGIQMRLNTDYIEFPQEKMILEIDLDYVDDIKKEIKKEIKNDIKKDEIKKDIIFGNKILNPNTGRYISINNPLVKKLGLLEKKGGELKDEDDDSYIGGNNDDDDDDDEEQSDDDEEQLGGYKEEEEEYEDDEEQSDESDESDDDDEVQLGGYKEEEDDEEESDDNEEQSDESDNDDEEQSEESEYSYEEDNNKEGLKNEIKIINI